MLTIKYANFRIPLIINWFIKELTVICKFSGAIHILQQKNVLLLTLFGNF